jgi:hypothetical protein
VFRDKAGGGGASAMGGTEGTTTETCDVTAPPPHPASRTHGVDDVGPDDAFAAASTPPPAHTGRHPASGEDDAPNAVEGPAARSALATTTNTSTRRANGMHRTV